MKELTQAIAGYLDYVQTNLAVYLGHGPDRDYLSAKVRPTPAAASDWFETFEGHPTWNKVAETCAQLFGKERHAERKWKGRARSWMRRRGTYLSLLDGVCPNPAEVADALVKDVETTEDRIVLLAPLEGLDFAKTEMDFGDFQILQLKPDQFELLLGVRANRIFYPYAARSTKRLTDHWYVHCENKEKRTLGQTYSYDDLFFGGGSVLAEYTHLPARIELFLKSIILWDEQEHGLGGDYWMPFVSIPFVIEVSDNPFKGPRPAPPIAEFRTYQPVFIDGEEIGEESQKIIDLNAEETTKFEVFVRRISGQLQSIRSVGNAWEYVDLGLNYLLKGFFSDGLDHILWHIVSLEAFLGEKGQGITDRLIRRVGAISSEDLARSEEARKTFSKLHTLRNDLVHGRREVQAHSQDLWNARTLGRTVGTRMLTLLSHLAEEIRAARLAYVPTREEVLGVLDVEAGSREKRADLLRVFSHMTS